MFRLFVGATVGWIALPWVVDRTLPELGQTVGEGKLKLGGALLGAFFASVAK